MPKFARCRGIWVCAILLVWGPLAQAGESVTSEWPCIHHKVPEITAGTSLKPGNSTRKAS
jgi:hypothetical protein